MILLDVQAVTKHYGPEAVLAGASFEVRPKERLALVGPNGAGKSTLLKILAGQESADSGSANLHPSARLAYLEQHATFPEGVTLWEHARAALEDVVQLVHRSEELAHALSAAEDEVERDRLGKQFDQLQHELQRRGGYNIDHRITRVLEGLGFQRGSFHQQVTELSGGQQNRLLLARLLLAEPDVMLLDEPSNHLDIEATAWLEDFLLESNQAMVIVSHDRYFLDRVSTRTLELFHGTIDSYPGNFSAYWRQKAERVEVQRRTYEKQQEEIAKAEDFIRRNHYGQKSTQAKDREKKLARIERVEPPRHIAAPPMGFPAAKRSGDIVLRAEGLSKAFDRPLFQNLTFQIERAERWGIVGPNGTGKTTLLRCLVGEQTPDSGRVTPGTGVKIGYFDQLLTGLDGNQPVVDAIRPSHKEFVENQRRDLLARFGLTGDMVFQSVGSLSGGERNRAALARLAASDANFLILDEPTNHLDLWARDALEKALRAFDGTVLFVSHDRYFLNQVADHLLVVEPDRFRVIEGNYDTYRHLASLNAVGKMSPATEKAGKSTPKAKKAVAEDTNKRRRRFPYRKVADLESEIFERESRIEELTGSLGTPEVVRSGEKTREIKAEIAEQQATLRTLYEHWEEATELN